jgi:hypothetical protein
MLPSLSMSSVTWWVASGDGLSSAKAAGGITERAAASNA